MKWLEIRMKAQPGVEGREQSWWQARRPATRAEREAGANGMIFYMPKAVQPPGSGHPYGQRTQPYTTAHQEGDLFCRVTEHELPVCPGTGMKWSYRNRPRCGYCDHDWSELLVQRPHWAKRFRNDGKWSTRVPPHADWRPENRRRRPQGGWAV